MEPCPHAPHRPGTCLHPNTPGQPSPENPEPHTGSPWGLRKIIAAAEQRAWKEREWLSGSMGGLSQCWLRQSGCSHFCWSSEELCLGSSPASVPRASWREPGNYSVPGFLPMSWPSHWTRKCVGLRRKERSPALGNLLSE